MGQLVFEAADLSQGGAFLKSDLLLEPDETLNMEFQIPHTGHTVRAQLRVVWVRRFPEEGEVPGMGVSFLAMSESDQQALDRYLAQESGS
jgi:c-di-GMP-binding flagellar brake protein YcgR